MSDWEQFSGDGDDSPEDVVRAFEQITAAIRGQHEDISVRFQKLNENVTKATGTLGDLVRSEYAGELARLGKSVNDLVQEQAALAKTVDKKQTAVRDLYDASRSLKGQDTRLSSVTGDLEELRQKLNGILARPAERAEQLRALIWFSGAGVLAGVLTVFLGLWALPDRAETAVARTIMGANYWDSAWRMMKVHSQSELERFAVLNEIDTDDGRLEQLKICLDQAQKSGEPRECTAVFSP